MWACSFNKIFCKILVKQTDGPPRLDFVRTSTFYLKQNIKHQRRQIGHRKCQNVLDVCQCQKPLCQKHPFCQRGRKLATTTGSMTATIELTEEQRFKPKFEQIQKSIKKEFQKLKPWARQGKFPFFLWANTSPDMPPKQVLLLSSSRVQGYDFLEYAAGDIRELLSKNKVKKISFVPYALVNHDDYTSRVSEVFNKWGYDVEGVHKHNPAEVLKKAEAIFVGGGNTFLLLNTLYEFELLEVLRSRVNLDGIPYIGASAGTNIAGLTISNTNDMPIIHPPSLMALQLIPFNINPHYIDPDENGIHKGETRQERILQYQELPHSVNVLAMREGAHILIEGNTIVLKGISGARLFEKKNTPREFKPDTDLSFLIPETCTL